MAILVYVRTVTSLIATSREQVPWERRNHHQFGVFYRTKNDRSVFHHPFEDCAGAYHNVASHVIFTAGSEGERDGAVKLFESVCQIAIQIRNYRVLLVTPHVLKLGDKLSDIVQ
jgi:hypothetical protein